LKAMPAIRLVAFSYATLCLLLAIPLGELPFHAQRRSITERRQAELMVTRFGAILKDISVTAGDGTHLTAWFASPTNDNRNAAILLHGVGDNREGMLGFAELLLSTGFSVLLPDSRAQGESGGSFPSYGILESDDTERWFTWLQTETHPRCIYGMGESMGAAILLQAAAKESRFCAIVAESPFASFRQIAFVRVGQFFHTGPWLGRVALRPAVELAFLYGRMTRGIDLTKASPEAAVRVSRVPILLIHGLVDDNIPYQQSESIHAHNPVGTTLWKVPNAGHCGAVSADPQQFNARVLGWFASHDGSVAVGARAAR
jgi:uncharacterized protein